MTDSARRGFLQLGLLAASMAAARAAPAPPALDLLRDAHELLAGLGAAEFEPFLRNWPPAAMRVATLRTVVPAAVPVLRWLPDLRAEAPTESATLVDAVVTGAETLAWRRSRIGEASGKGTRVEGRPCNATFVKRN